MAQPTDMTDIMKVMEAAKGIMRSSGNMHQWTGGYPSEVVIMSDMERGGSFVVVEDDRVIAYFALLPSPEPTYDKIYKGEWKDDVQPYHVVHRIASYSDSCHVFRDIMDFCFAVEGCTVSGCSLSPKCRNIRIDTHRDNTIMQHVVTQYGFSYCGIIFLANGEERLAYQKMV